MAPLPRPVPVSAGAVARGRGRFRVPPAVVWDELVPCDVHGCAEPAVAGDDPIDLNTGAELPFFLCDTHTLTYLHHHHTHTHT